MALKSTLAFLPAAPAAGCGAATAAPAAAAGGGGRRAAKAAGADSGRWRDELGGGPSSSLVPRPAFRCAASFCRCACGAQHAYMLTCCMLHAARTHLPLVGAGPLTNDARTHTH